MLTIPALRHAYASGATTPEQVIEIVLARIAVWPDDAVWISRFSDEELRQQARALSAAGPSADQPLWGIPCAVKDNIDVLGLPTTAACPAFAYPPQRDATAVARLRAAGAMVIGKTNLDQFATGLNGTRSPYGAPRSVFHADYISGGSSSGSAVAVASGQVAFALGTDTAGSGRIPAAFNNLVGVKPTKGLVPNTGLVPACKSLDCITVFAASVGEADLVRRVMQGFDAEDPYSRHASPQAVPPAPRFGVLGRPERQFFGDDDTETLYDAAIARLESLGGTAVVIDYAPLRECADLLYGDAFVAERLAGIENFFTRHRDMMDPTVAGIVAGGQAYSAADAFRAQYRLEELRRQTAAIWRDVDILLLPTAPTIYTVANMLAAPLKLNANLGRYTNFVNLLDCAAVAIPAGFRADGLPAGVTLIGPAFADDALASLADRLQRAFPTGTGRDRDAALPGMALAKVTAERFEIGVVGAHLSGMPLNGQLLAAGGWPLRSAHTAADYRMFALPDSRPAKPGVIREPGFAGPGLEVEIWSLPLAAAAQFIAAIGAPLGIGRIELADGSEVSGFLCEAHAVRDAEDITAYGGWRGYICSTVR